MSRSKSIEQVVDDAPRVFILNNGGHYDSLQPLSKQRIIAYWGRSMILRRRSRGSSFIEASLWLAAFAAGAYLGYRRDDTSSLNRSFASDFGIYFHAAREIAAGHSPYVDHQYVYPPLFALLLAPFSSFHEASVLDVWQAISVTAVAVAVLGTVVMVASKLSPIQRPILFGFCIVTAYHFWPLDEAFFLGQADSIVLATLVVALLASNRLRPIWSGIFAGIAGLMKAWPAGAALYFLRRGGQRGTRSLIAFISTMLLAPLAALAIGGVSGLAEMFKNVFDARTQTWLIGYSVWGIPRIVFSRSNLARAIVISPQLRDFATLALLAWVVFLGLTSLRGAKAEALTFWHVVACCVLLLPVSHVAYCVYALPILWLWAARVLQVRTVRVGDLKIVAIFTVIAACWLVLTIAWPTDGSSPRITALSYSVPFIVTLVALTASVLGQRFFLGGAPDRETEAAGSQPGTDRTPAQATQALSTSRTTEWSSRHAEPASAISQRVRGVSQL